MKWKLLEPSGGERRIIRRFLILPRYIDGECRWLEYAIILQEYILIRVDEQTYSKGCWKDLQFLTRREALSYIKKRGINVK